MLKRLNKKYNTSILTALFCCASLSTATFVWASDVDFNLPDLGSSANSSFTKDRANKLGDAYIRQARSQLEFIDDPLLLNYLNALGNELVIAAIPNPVDRQKFTFHLINNPQINAFALPGGHIVIHSGLIHHSKSVQQLAGTLAHEIAHITQDHAARSIENNSGNSAIAIASILIAAAAKSPDAAQAAIIATQGSILHKRLAYSRSFEKEADNNAIRTLHKAGYNPNALSDFLKILHSKNISGTNPPEFLMTHPLTSSRISEADQRARSYPTPLENNKSESKFKDFQAVINAEFHNKPATTTKYFQTSNKPLTAHDNLQYSLALRKNNQFKQAQKQINYALKKDPDNIYYKVADAELATSKQDYAAANSKFLKIKSQQPSAYPLIAIYHANALIVSKQQKEAITLLKASEKENPNDPFIHILLARAYGEIDKQAKSFQSRARYHYLRGNYTFAMKQLDKAIALTQNNFQKRKLTSQKETYEAERDAIKAALK